MSFIKNIFSSKGKKSDNTESDYSKNYIDLLSRSIGTIRLRQLKFADIIGNQDWNVDFAIGKIMFGDNVFPIDFIGSESNVSNTWMWGSNNVNGFSDELVRGVTAFVKKTEIQNTKEINNSSFKIDGIVSGHYLATIYAYYNKGCYYRCVHEKGAAFVLMKNVPEEVFVSADAEVVMSTITQLISDLPLNQLLLVRGLFDNNCIRYDNMDGRLLRGYFRDGKQIEVSFDELNRIENMKFSNY